MVAICTVQWRLQSRALGGGVDVITAFDDEGLNTHLIFDDPKLKNLETDVITRPLGAGQGFRERPWSWDKNHEPTFGYREIATTTFVGSNGGALTGSLTLNDNLGDRVVEVAVNEVGNFESNSIEIDVLFDENHLLDSNQNFVEATLSAYTTRRMVSFVLDENGTFEDTGGLAGAQSIGVYFLKSQMLMFC